MFNLLTGAGVQVLLSLSVPDNASSSSTTGEVGDAVFLDSSALEEVIKYPSGNVHVGPLFSDDGVVMDPDCEIEEFPFGTFAENIEIVFEDDTEDNGQDAPPALTIPQPEENAGDNEADEEDDKPRRRRPETWKRNLIKKQRFGPSSRQPKGQGSKSTGDGHSLCPEL